MVASQAQGGRAASPAAVLASYLTHPLLSPELQDGLIRVLAALGEASAPLAHVCYTACLTHCEGELQEWKTASPLAD